MSTPTCIGVVDDSTTVAGSHIYRVDYGEFAIMLESVIALTPAEAQAKADATLQAEQP